MKNAEFPVVDEADRAGEAERIAAAPLLRIERGGFRYRSRGTWLIGMSARESVENSLISFRQGSSRPGVSSNIDAAR